MRAFCRCRQKGVKKAKIKAEINRSALAGEPDHLERWLMALWVPLGLRKLGKDDFILYTGSKYVMNALFSVVNMLLMHYKL